MSAHPSPSITCRTPLLLLGILTLGLLVATGSQAATHLVDFGAGCKDATPGCTVAQPCTPIHATVGVAIDDTIEGQNLGGNIPTWSFDVPPGCAAVTDGFDCNGVQILLPNATTCPGDSVCVSSTVPHGGPGAPTAQGTFTFGLEGFTGSGLDCTSLASGEVADLAYEGFELIIAPSGGEGEPHMTTVDGVHYDFQGDGEFVLLRGDGLEIQTRMTGIATSHFPGTNPYTGLASCVSINSAVAARVGERRVTYQPNISGVPDPSGLQLRIDGVLTTLDAGGIDLGSGGRIEEASANGAIRIDFPNGASLLVTPGWWNYQSLWYMNANVYSTTASEGLVGALAPDSWLPALPDGTSLGPRPSALPDRRAALYKKFGNAWRVTEKTSLFDYAPGTSTADFTLASWPKDSPPCELPREPEQPPGPISDPVDQEVAQQACEVIDNAQRRANCVFDVRVTGELGFADTYLATQQIEQGEQVTGAASPDTWAISLHLGYPIALGDFDNLGADGELSFSADLEWRFSPQRSLELVFGRYAFEIDPAAIDVDIDGLSAYYKGYSAPVGSSRLFWQLGPGAFDVQPGLSTVGISGGVGWQSPITSNLEFEVAGMLFHLFSTGAQDDIDFVLAQAGFKLTF